MIFQIVHLDLMLFYYISDFVCSWLFQLLTEDPSPWALFNIRFIEFDGIFRTTSCPGLSQIRGTFLPVFLVMLYLIPKLLFN